MTNGSQYEEASESDGWCGIRIRYLDLRAPDSSAREKYHCSFANPPIEFKICKRQRGVIYVCEKKNDHTACLRS